GDQLFFSWNFGDGQVSKEQAPTHTYDEPGTYMPKVEVQDPSGERATCATAWVIVE
ncbi:MAG: PKD domain-containing protein, partial [bacterium]|nr:PKD domain-containing protein [bacterium]